ncbi:MULTISPECIES: hypothetical protein [Amycolatopsis]|uniref:Uncharacterized protein n=1 Tax=Amycolatopsis albidoflavus TaxID=102226 RepID=A0ABW5I706_9PSEU
MTNKRQRETRGQYPAAVRAVQRSVHQRRTGRKGGSLGGIRSLT